eukprot:XP_001704638.1 Hypothetical protein GL50803_102070 [Giardia lamblia ATCC 50803]
MCQKKVSIVLDQKKKNRIVYVLFENVCTTKSGISLLISNSDHCLGYFFKYFATSSKKGNTDNFKSFLVHSSMHKGIYPEDIFK